MPAQRMLLVLATFGGVALLQATNPVAPPAGAESIDNDLAPRIITPLFAGGVAPWLSLLVTHRFLRLRTSAALGDDAAIVLWLTPIAMLLGATAFAAFFMCISAIVCAVDAYERRCRPSTKTPASPS